MAFNTKFIEFLSIEKSFIPNDKHKLFVVDDSGNETELTFSFGNPPTGEDDEGEGDDKRSSSGFLKTTILGIALLFALF